MRLSLFTSLCSLALVLLASSSMAQRGLSSRPVVDLGTYEVATGRWIAPPPGDAITIPLNSIYDNTCVPSTGVIAVEFTDEDEIVVDVGQLPGSTNTIFGIDPSKLHDEYLVQGFRLAVCPAEPDSPSDPTPISATMFWWNCLDSCLLGGSIAGLTPTATITIDNIPAGGVGGTCFLFDVDISGTPLEFVLTGDCDGVLNGAAGGAAGDTFGYGLTVQRSDGMPLVNKVSFGLGGDPGTQSVGFGCQLADGNAGPAGFVGESTSFLNETRHADSSTGFGNVDDFMDAVGGAVPFCFSLGYSFGLPNTAYVGLFHEIYGVPLFVSEFPETCNGDGGDQLGCTDCACMNNALPGTVGGCLNSAGRSARLEGSGVPSVANDTLRFEMTGAPGTAFTILNSGNQVAPQNMANPCFGLMSGAQAAQYDGLRCAVQGTQRHGGRPADLGGDIGKTNNGWGPPNGPPIGLVAQGGFVAGQTRHYQAIYREDPLVNCMRGLNTSQAVTVLFTP